MNDRFILLKRHDQLIGMQSMLLEAWLNDYPILKDAYDLKEDFFGLWDYASRYEAMQLIKNGLPV
jgi:transposase